MLYNYPDDPPDSKNLQCWVCGGDVTEVNSVKDTIFLQCKNCSSELDRLTDVESDLVEVRERFNFLLEKYSIISKLQDDLQNYLKTLTS